MTRGTLSAENRASGLTHQSASDRRVTGGYNQPRAITSWRQARLAAGLSFREVEEQTHINRGELSRIERGIGPRMDHARRLPALFDEAGS